ncbi:MAG: hypothetical protein ACUVRY_07415 [Thermoanaerobaculaceae bacterium]
MNKKHLDDEKLFLILLGEEDDRTRSHLASCPACGEELASWQRMQEAAARWRPSWWRRWWLRQGVLWRLRPRRLWPAAIPLGALAALVVALVLFPQPSQQPIDVEAVLAEVDATLASDPLAAFAEENLVAILVPEGSSGEGSNS